MFSYPCTVTDVPADGIAVVRVDMFTGLILDVDLDPDVIIAVDLRMLKDVMLDVAVDMLSGTDIIAIDTPSITLEFVVEVADVLTDVGLAAVMTPLELTLSSPWEDPMPFC